MALDPRDYFTVQKARGKTHASFQLNTFTLCSGPKVTSTDPKLMRAPEDLVHLFTQVDCLTCTRELLRRAELL